MSRTCNAWGVRALVVVLAAAPCAADWIVVENPSTQQPEAVWSSAHDGIVDVCFSSLQSTGWTQQVVLGETTESAVPALAISAGGDRVAAWESDEKSILVRTWPAGESDWGNVAEASDVHENASGPSVLGFDGDTFVSYEAVSESGTRWVTVAKMDPDGTPQRDLIRTTSSAGALRAGLVASASTLYVDWIESRTSMGYSTFSDGAWSEPEFQSYENMSPKAMRAHLRETLLQK